MSAPLMPINVTTLKGQMNAVDTEFYLNDGAAATDSDAPTTVMIDQLMLTNTSASGQTIYLWTETWNGAAWEEDYSLTYPSPYSCSLSASSYDDCGEDFYNVAYNRESTASARGMRLDNTKRWKLVCLGLGVGEVVSILAVAHDMG